VPRKILPRMLRTGLAVVLPAAACGNALGADETGPNQGSAMDPVVVTARNLQVETLIDRKVYSVAADVQATFGTVSDVLTAIPSVDVDPEGIVSLRGDSSVLILIDGKPSAQFAGASAGDNLQSMSAADIERIEVITTPPAQFKADGAAGVINIVTRSKRPDGWAGTVQGSAGNGGRAVAGGRASFSEGPLTASVMAGFRHDYRLRHLASDVLAPAPGATQATESRSVLDERMHREVPSAGASSEYKIDDRRAVSAAASWSERGGLRTYIQQNSDAAPGGALAGFSQRSSVGHDPDISIDERLGYSQGFGRDGEKLDVSLHRSASHQHERYDYVNASFIPPAAASLSNLTLLEDNATTEVGVDYTLPLSRSRSLKLGYAYEDDGYYFGNIGNTVDPLTLVETSDPAVSHAFAYRQRIHAGYLNFQASAGQWNWLAGARAELVRTYARQLTTREADDGAYSRLYPSLHADRALSDVSTLSLGASRRISRPDPGNLDPYVDHEYAPNLRAGNAGLRPQYTASYEAGYGYEGKGLSAQITAYYRANRDTATDVTQYLGNGISLTTKANLPRNNSTGVEFTTDGHIVPALAFSLSGNLFHAQIDATQLGDPGLRSTIGVNAKLKFDYRPSAVDSTQLMVTRTDRRLTPQGYVSAIDIVNLGYRRQMRQDLAAIATVTDLFNGQHYDRVEATPTLSGDFLRAVRGRLFYVGLVYSFGSARKGKETKLEFDQPE